MPLRRWMDERGHPAWYSWLVVIGGCLTTLLLAVIISVSVSDRAIEKSEEQNRLSLQRSKEAACLVITSQDQAYKEAPPSTPAGVQAAKAWGELRRSFQCDGGN